MFGRGRRGFRDMFEEGGRGMGGGPKAAGPGGNCVCPKCGETVKHIVGTPCNTRPCPKCGTKMVRE